MPKIKDVKKEVDEVLSRMEEVADDRSVPRNIRNTIAEAIEKVKKEEKDFVNYSTAIYLLDDISNDINMPSHARTDIWEIISMLESIKEKVK